MDKGKIQALWFGADIPTNAAPGDYEGKITLISKGGVSRDMSITLRVSKEVAVNHGDDKPADLTRLRWLNSQLAADDSMFKTVYSLYRAKAACVHPVLFVWKLAIVIFVLFVGERGGVHCQLIACDAVDFRPLLVWPRAA